MVKEGIGALENSSTSSRGGDPSLSFVSSTLVSFLSRYTAHASIRPNRNETEADCDPFNPNNCATEADSRPTRTIFFSTASGNRAANAGQHPINKSMRIQGAVCAWPNNLTYDSVSFNYLVLPLAT